MMNDKKKKYFKRLLEQKLGNLLSGKIRNLTEKTNHSEKFPDPMDRATSESEKTFSLILRQREDDTISKINLAIEKIDEGEYGICEGCGEFIAIERLKIRPEARLCIQCKLKQELF